MKAVSSPGFRRFPVTVTRLPVTPRQIRRRTVACRPGRLSEVLTEHHRPRSARPPVPVASLTGRTIPRRRRGSFYRPGAAFLRGPPR